MFVQSRRRGRSANMLSGANENAGTLKANNLIHPSLANDTSGAVEGPGFRLLIPWGLDILQKSENLAVRGENQSCVLIQHLLISFHRFDELVKTD